MPALPVKKVTTASLNALKTRGEKATFLTAYDFPTASFADRAGIDLLLVGDSAAMTVLGHPNTLAITMTEMLVFARAVARRVRAMTDAGIAVMGHLGLTPQAIGQQGGYRVQGKTLAATECLLDDAVALQDAGAFAILLEAVPAVCAAYLRERLDVLVYGIGAGPDVDGQLVISHDLLGNFVGDIAPKFVTRYANLDGVVEHAFRRYADDVRAGRFPSPEHCYPIDPAEADAIREAGRFILHAVQPTPSLARASAS